MFITCITLYSIDKTSLCVTHPFTGVCHQRYAKDEEKTRLGTQTLKRCKRSTTSFIMIGLSYNGSHDIHRKAEAMHALCTTRTICELPPCDWFCTSDGLVTCGVRQSQSSLETVDLPAKRIGSPALSRSTCESR